MHNLLEYVFKKTHCPCFIPIINIFKHERTGKDLNKETYTSKKTSASAMNKLYSLIYRCTFNARTYNINPLYHPHHRNHHNNPNISNPIVEVQFIFNCVLSWPGPVLIHSNSSQILLVFPAISWLFYVGAGTKEGNSHLKQFHSYISKFS